MGRLPKRVMGVETEYGIHSSNDSNLTFLSQSLVLVYQGEQKKHTNFGPTNQSILGHRDSDPYRVLDGDYRHQPTYLRYGYGSGIMIANGGRFYVDMGHPEFCTPEVTTARDALLWDKAGERILNQAAKSVRDTNVYKNNSDGKGNSYGTHENYSMRRVSETDFREVIAKGILPFLVTRMLFTGSGKIGVENSSPKPTWPYDASSEQTGPFEKCLDSAREKILGALDEVQPFFSDDRDFSRIEEELQDLFARLKKTRKPPIYQLSPRADFICQEMGLQTTFDRPIINTRDEPHADEREYMRLHVICDDANLCEIASYLKVGTTSLVLDLIEDGLAPKLVLADPVRQRRRISRDQSRRWVLKQEDGKTISAPEIQREYWKKAFRNYSGRDQITDDVLKRWGEVLDILEGDPNQHLQKLFGKVDWATKKAVLEMVAIQSGLPLDDPKLAKAELAYHNVDPGKSAFYALQRAGKIERIVSDEEIDKAVSHPPHDTRAYLRAKVLKRPDVYNVDWGGFIILTEGSTEGNLSQKLQVKINNPLSGTQGDLLGLHDTPENPVPAKRLLERLKTLPGVTVETLEKIHPQRGNPDFAGGYAEPYDD